MSSASSGPAATATMRRFSSRTVISRLGHVLHLAYDEAGLGKETLVVSERREQEEADRAPNAHLLVSSSS